MMKNFQKNTIKGTLILLLSVAIIGTTSSAFGLNYFGFEEWGGTWYDAEKSPSNTEDDLMCWAGAASNILAWSGWGFGAGFSSEDDIFGYYQDHWTDAGSLMLFGWYWWFTGTNPSQYWDGWSQVDAAGGGFWTEYVFSDYYHEQNDDAIALEAIDEFLHSGYGVTLGVFRSGRNSGHAITVWGYEYDDQGSYLGIYVSDSDNSKHIETDNPPNDLPNELNYYEVSYDMGKWYLQDFYGKDDAESDSWYISKVQALDRNPDTGIVPEPGTLLLLGLGLIGVIALKRKTLKK